MSFFKRSKSGLQCGSSLAKPEVCIPFIEMSGQSNGFQQGYKNWRARHGLKRRGKVVAGEPGVFLNLQSACAEIESNLETRRRSINAAWSWVSRQGSCHHVNK
jgi:hypothetical protein